MEATSLLTADLRTASVLSHEGSEACSHPSGNLLPPSGGRASSLGTSLNSGLMGADSIHFFSGHLSNEEDNPGRLAVSDGSLA